MELYQNMAHNASIFNKILDKISEADLFSISQNLSQFASPNFSGIDSLRFTSTAKFISKFTNFLQTQGLTLNETAFKTNHFRLYDLYGYKTPKTALFCKVSQKVSIYIYSTSETLDKARKAHRDLKGFRFLEIHGLSQYDSQAKEPLKLDRKTERILKFLLEFIDNRKNRQNLILKSLDYSLDYFIKKEVNAVLAQSIAPYLTNLDNCKLYKPKALNTIYAQTSTRKRAKPINGILQKVRFYDKKIKHDSSRARETMQRHIIRAELVFVFDKTP
ncbi:hypothetical protein OFN73_06680 [Campylobacter sp. JMF_14 EL1]|nr:hypothetical protein [Campylobacter sp. JMF_14 EL1]